jgi:hypothetical protein
MEMIATRRFKAGCCQTMTSVCIHHALVVDRSLVFVDSFLHSWTGEPIILSQAAT